MNAMQLAKRNISWGCRVSLLVPDTEKVLPPFPWPDPPTIERHAEDLTQLLANLKWNKIRRWGKDHTDANGNRLAGKKRLALLRSAVAAAGLRETLILHAVCDDTAAGAHLGDGELQMSAGLCDALIELMANLPVALVPAGGNGHAA